MQFFFLSNDAGQVQKIYDKLIVHSFPKIPVYKFIRTVGSENAFSIIRQSGPNIEGMVSGTYSKTEVRLHLFCCHPVCRRQGVATSLIQEVKNLTPSGKIIFCHVSEREVASQLLLRKCGFICDRIEPEILNGDKAYRFRYVV